jgi:hypothetical protein
MSLRVETLRVGVTKGEIIDRDALPKTQSRFNQFPRDWKLTNKIESEIRNPTHKIKIMLQI